MENVVEDVIPDSLGESVPKAGFGGEKNFKLPSMDEFMRIMEQINGLSDEEKEQLKESMLKKSLVDRKMTIGFSEYIIFSTMVVLIASVFVFFGYKLYLSLTEKERRKEEKQKAKQAKKKK